MIRSTSHAVDRSPPLPNPLPRSGGEGTIQTLQRGLRGVLGRFGERTQDFGDAPGLGGAAARGVGGVRVKNFGNGPHAGFTKVGVEPAEEVPAFALSIRIGSQPGIDKRTDQPAPDRSLMIGGIARPQVARIDRFVIRMTGSERA